jgi:hypothetical protein
MVWDSNIPHAKGGWMGVLVVGNCAAKNLLTKEAVKRVNGGLITIYIHGGIYKDIYN